jgi:hypothetical protein
VGDVVQTHTALIAVRKQKARALITLAVVALVAIWGGHWWASASAASTISAKDDLIARNGVALTLVMAENDRMKRELDAVAAERDRSGLAVKERLQNLARQLADFIDEYREGAPKRDRAVWDAADDATRLKLGTDERIQHQEYNRTKRAQFSSMFGERITSLRNQCADLGITGWRLNLASYDENDHFSVTAVTQLRRWLLEMAGEIEKKEATKRN